jgi:hypothetical protein
MPGKYWLKWLTVCLLLSPPVTALGDEGQGDSGNGAASPPSAEKLWRNLDDKRPDDQYRVLLYGRPLTIGGEYEFKPTYRENYSLGTRDDDLLRLDTSIDLELLYEISPDLSLVLEGKYKYRNDLYEEGGPEEKDDRLERGETWLYASNLLGGNWGIQAGRQNIREKREWWWDEDLDSVRVHYTRPGFEVQLAAGEELGSVSADEEINPEKDEVFRIIGRATWHWARKQRVEFFFLDQNDHSDTPASGDIFSGDNNDEVDGDLTWYGVRALGRIKYRPLGQFYYWLDTGYVDGRETVIDFDDFEPGGRIVDTVDRQDIRGWAADLGVTWETNLSWKPSFTFGFAHGSGDDDPDDGTDHSFRQTGLQDNNGKYRGVNRFRYYGELLRPELSNLNIVTLSVGFPLLSNSSIEFPLHYYRQVDASTMLRDADLETRPGGKSKSIGTEFDIAVGIEEWKHLELELIAGLFRAGSAFGSRSGDYAGTAIFKLNYNF